MSSLTGDTDGGASLTEDSTAAAAVGIAIGPDSIAATDVSSALYGVPNAAGLLHGDGSGSFSFSKVANGDLSLGLTAAKRVKTDALGAGLVAQDIDGSEITTGTISADRLPSTLNGSVTVQGASTLLSMLAVRSAVGDYGRFEMGTSGSGQWYLEKDSSGNLVFYKGAYGSGTNYWSFLSDGSATMRPATVGANVTTQIAMGIPSSTQYGQVWIQYQSASVPGGGDDQIVFRGVQNGVGDSLPIARFQRTGVALRKPTTCQDGLTIANDLICGTTCIANFNTSTNQLRFRPGGGGFSSYFNVSQPASANRVINFIDPGAANRTVLYTDLAQACTLGAITSDGTISFTGSSITLGNASADALIVNATTSFTAPISAVGITATGDISFTGVTMTFGDAPTDTITVGAASNFTGPVTVADITATGTVTLGSVAMGALSASSLAVSGAATVGTTLGVTGTSTLADVNAASLATSGAVTVGTTLGVTGASTLAAVSAASVSTSGAVAVGTTLGVTGASTLAAVSATSVATSGAVTVGTTLGVTGASTLASLGVTGAATVGTTLGVTGTSTLAAVNCTALTASGAVSFTRSAGPQLTIPGGADPSTSEIWLGTDSGGTAMWRVLQGSVTYGNKYILRSVLGGSSVDQFTLTPTTASIAQPLGVGGAANTSYKLYVQSGVSNFSDGTVVPASSVKVANFSGSYGTAYSANADIGDAGRWLQLYNSSTSTSANIQVVQSFHIIGAATATRVINDLKVIRETLNQPNGAFVLTGRTNATGSVTMRDYAYFGYNKAYVSPGAGNPVTIGSQTAPTSGYQVAIGTAGGTTDGNLEVNGGMLVRGSVVSPLAIDGSSTSTFAGNMDIGDSMRFLRVTNTSTDVSSGIMTAMSFRVGPSSASPVQCDLVVSRDGGSTRGGFSFNSKDASSGTGYWTMASFTPRLCYIKPDWSGYGSGVAGITLNSTFTPSAGYAVAVGSPGSYNADGALEVAGNTLVRGTLTASGASTLASVSATSLTVSGTLIGNGNVVLGDATTDTVTINGDTTCTYKLACQGSLTAQAALTVLGRLTGPTADYTDLSCRAFWPVNDSGTGYNTWQWAGSGGVLKTSVAAATQKVIVTWTGSWTAPGASKHAGVSFKDIITCTRHSTGEICRSEVVWCVSLSNALALVSSPSSIIATSTTASGSQVVALSFAFTNVSGSTYTAVATYTLNNISTTSDMDMDVDSTISARKSILTAVTGYQVTSST